MTLEPVNVNMSLPVDGFRLANYPVETISPSDIVVEWTGRGPLEIPRNMTSARFTIVISSRVNGKLTIRSDHPDMILSERFPAPLEIYRGETTSASFLAFSEHSGTVTLLNDAGEVVAVIPYTVTKSSDFRNRVSASYNFESNFTASYSLTHMPSSTTVSLGLSYDFEKEAMRGTISGSHSW